MSNSVDVAIVGAGHGGAQAAIMLRQQKFEGTIALIGDEPDFPYERPPLSKEYFAGDKPFERIMIRPEKFWAERDVQMMLGRHVSAIDSEAHQLSFSDGETLYGFRHASSGPAPTLYVSEALDHGGRAVASEPLCGMAQRWTSVPQNTLCKVTAGGVEMVSLEEVRAA